MTTKIAASIASVIDSNTELIELNQATSYWQRGVSEVIDEDEEPYLVFPQTTDILANLVKQSHREQWRILICGGGSKLNWGNLTENIQLVISTQNCDRLIEHAVGDLTITVEAGMKLHTLQDILRSHNQFIPIDPSYRDCATVGGIVATADTGSWREGYGGIRDLLLGLSFVRADGAIAKAGGRVVKNVAGYDLMKLFTGAYGSLGIISQLTFRTYPLIATSQTLVLTGQARAIAEACQSIRNSGLTPTAVDLLSGSLLTQLELGEGVGLIARWQTIPESIVRQIEQVKAIASKLNLTTRDFRDSAEVDLWQKCSTIVNLPQSDTAVTCKIGVAPTSAVNFLQSKEVIENETAIRIHVSSGIGKLQLNKTDDQTLSKMRSYCQENHGFLSILDAPKSIKQQIDVWGYTGNARSTMKTIKDRFDSQNILNPSRFIV